MDVFDSFFSGKTEAEQLHLIVKVIGTPTEQSWQVSLIVRVRK